MKSKLAPKPDLEISAASIRRQQRGGRFWTMNVVISSGSTDVFSVMYALTLGILIRVGSVTPFEDLCLDRFPAPSSSKKASDWQASVLLEEWFIESVQELLVTCDACDAWSCDWEVMLLDSTDESG
jgi:hypothetical protein